MVEQRTENPRVGGSIPSPGTIFALSVFYLRNEFRVALLEDGGASVVPMTSYGESGDFVSASKSDGLLILPENRKEFSIGEAVEFHPWELFKIKAVFVHAADSYRGLFQRLAFDFGRLRWDIGIRELVSEPRLLFRPSVDLAGC